MDNKNDNLSVSLEYNEAQTIPLAIHEMHMARNDRRTKWLCIGWALSVIIIVITAAYVFLQYDYSSTVETSGVYNLVDSQGNVLTSDISPDAVYGPLYVLLC